MSESIDLGLQLLDHQLVDCEGRLCGKVDDLALEGGPGETPEVAAILVGPGVWPQRARWIGRAAAAIARGGRVRIPWAEVEDVGAHVTLRRTAREYGLGRGDDRARPWIARLPGSSR